MNDFIIKICSILVRYNGFTYIFLFSTDSFGNEKSAHRKNNFACKIVSWNELKPNIKLTTSVFSYATIYLLNYTLTNRFS